MKRLLILTLLLTGTAACNRADGDNSAANALDAQALNVAAGMQNRTAPPNGATSWQTSANGLRYRRTRGDGSGPKPAANAIVTLHYVGTLEDGTVFDSSIERGAPVTMALPDLIPAWQQGVPMMSTGDVYQFVVPPELGYGAQGAGPIPPNATLHFEIALLRIDS
jgi:FKBP-type peptidyl-prolyl cis-trans isomerase